MNSKQRVYEAICHRQPDRVPKFVWIGKRVYERLCEKMKVTPIELQLKLGNDVLQTWLSINGQMEREAAEGEQFTDEWGVTWKRQGYYNMVIQHPMKGMDASEIKNYTFPDPYNPERYKHLEYLLENLGNSHFIGADVSGTIFEPSYHLRGMEEFMVDLALENPEVGVLLDKTAEFSTKVAQECVKRGVDWIWLGDDIGTQNGMIMSPDMWRNNFKPRMKRIVEDIRKIKNDIIIVYHSCGSMYPVIADLIEIGVNVINPIQESAVGMDQGKIKREYGNSVSLMCGLDTQKFMINATPGEVRVKTRQLLKELGKGGGYIFSVSHTLQPDVPDENILAMFEELDRVDSIFV